MTVTWFCCLMSLEGTTYALPKPNSLKTFSFNFRTTHLLIKFMKHNKLMFDLITQILIDIFSKYICAPFLIPYIFSLQSLQFSNCHLLV